MGMEQWPALRKMWLRKTRGRGDVTAWMAGMLKKKVSVVPGRESNVIDISVQWPDPKIAAQLANAFAQAFIATSVELKVDPAKHYSNWYEERARALRADLEEKQKRLSDFETQKGIIGTDDKLDIENTRLSELSTQLVVAEGQRVDGQSRVSHANRDSMPEVLQSPIILALKENLATVESRQQELAARLGTSHPEYLSVQKQSDELHAKINAESDKILASLRNTSQVNQRRESELAAAVAEQKRRVLELKHDRDQAAIMQSDVATSQRNLDQVTQRLAQTSLESQTLQGNIVLLTAATEPAYPSSPIYVLNGALGLIIGILLGIGAALVLEFADPRIRGEDELVTLLGVPLLGKLDASIPSAFPALALSGSSVPRLEAPAR
jgi:chain length determinant protein EpsF